MSFPTKTKTTDTTTTAAGTRNISPIFDRKIDEETQRMNPTKAVEEGPPYGYALSWLGDHE
ncbi:MAG: hypothetical protein M3146_01560 [Thermoproteota archaeon]|nr:hypothetical protein [Thermoproteota archaeon]